MTSPLKEHGFAEAGQVDPLAESCLDSEVIFQGRLLDVRRDTVCLPDGTESTREYIKHPGAVAVVPVLDGGRLIVERQFRYPVGRSFIEFPAGKIDPGESIEDCARRELREETGFEATDWKYLGVMHPCIGYSDERIEIFLARGLVEVGNDLDDGEFLEIHSMSLAELEQAVFDGRVTDSKTITALFLARPYLVSD